MKTKTCVLGTALVITLASSAWADNAGNEHRDADGPYSAREIVFEGFGTASFGRETIDNISSNRIKNDARLGAGIGMSYFLTRHFGVGGDAYVENAGHSFVDIASASAIFRVPIGSTRIVCVP